MEQYDYPDEHEAGVQADVRPVSGYSDEDAEYERRQRFCAACQEREKDTSESSSSALCYECRQQYMKLRVPLKIKIFLAAVCAVFALSLAMLPPVLSNYRIYLDAERDMKAREYAFAFNKYSAMLERYHESVPIILKTADAAMSAQYFGDLAHVFDTYLVGKSLDDKQYEKAMEYSDLMDSYFGTLQEIEGVGMEIGEALASNHELDIAQMFHDKLEPLLAEDGADKTLVYFYLGNTSQDADSAVKYLELATKQDSRFTYVHSYYGNALRRAGKLDEAEQVYRSAIERNANDASSWRGLSILQLLAGQKEQSLESIRYAYEIEPYGLYIPEALVITLCENNLRDEAMTELTQFVSGGLEVEEDLQAYLDGNINVEQYYMG